MQNSKLERIAARLGRVGGGKGRSFLNGKVRVGGRRMINRERDGSHTKDCGTMYRGCAPECTMWDEHGNRAVESEDYLERFYILSTPWVGIYLHRFWADDDDGLHDHPWNSISILLHGMYFEEQPERQSVPYGPTITRERSPLHPICKLRRRYDAHRITISKEQPGAWSLFIRFGFKRRTWGFWRDGTWEPAEVQSREVDEAMVQWQRMQ